MIAVCKIHKVEKRYFESNGIPKRKPSRSFGMAARCGGQFLQLFWFLIRTGVTLACGML
jgi:hypothetical protein